VNRSIGFDSRGYVVGAILLATAFAFLQSFRGLEIPGDPFHEGEFYVATIGNSSDRQTEFHPLAIHGALDVIPALIAERIWGAENYFLPTRAIYQLLSFLAAMTLIGIAYRLTRGNASRAALLLAIGLAAPLLLGYRDLLLLALLYLFIVLVETERKTAATVLLHVLFGLCAGIALYWSYDRGIAGSVSLGAATLILLAGNRMYAIALLSFFVTIAILASSFEMFSIRNYADDIRTLVATSGQWSFGSRAMPVLLSVFAAALNLFALVVLFGRGVGSRSAIAEFVAFGLLSAFMLRIGTGRADLEHVYFGLWVPLLAALRSCGRERPTNLASLLGAAALFCVAIGLAGLLPSFRLALVGGVVGFAAVSAKSTRANTLASSALLLLGIGCLVVVSTSSAKAIRAGKFSWIGDLARPPANRSLATDGVLWASGKLQQRNVNCVFDLSNGGMINGLVRQPSCSRFSYPVVCPTLAHDPLPSIRLVIADAAE
jgi:hypothetical protein